MTWKTRVFVGRTIVMAAASFIGIAGTAQASQCPLMWQHAYETGVRDGGADGAHQRDYDPTRHNRHFHSLVKAKPSRGDCYTEGYNIGYDNAVADVQTRGRYSHGGAPEAGSNERAYYDDGCHDGTGDAKMGMSMAYERHSDMYDTRFEPYFKQGYEACWKHYR